MLLFFCALFLFCVVRGAEEQAIGDQWVTID